MRPAEDLDMALNHAESWTAGALIVQPDNLLNQILGTRIAEFAASRRLPVVFSTRNPVVAVV